MQHMHDNIPTMFDCWADPVVHLLILLLIKSCHDQCDQMATLLFQYLAINSKKMLNPIRNLTNYKNCQCNK